MASALGVRLRRLREAKKLTLQQVADAAGCTKAYIWELEMREGQRPTAERLNAIAKLLGVTVLHLLGEPIGGIEDPTPADAEFFREYAGMTDDEKTRYREAMKLMFGAAKKTVAEK